MKVASIDCGTNSFHLMIGQINAQGQVEVIDRQKDMVRLGDSTFQSGVISPESFARAAEALRGFAERLREAGGEESHVVDRAAAGEAARRVLGIEPPLAERERPPSEVAVPEKVRMRFRPSTAVGRASGAPTATPATV